LAVPKPSAQEQAWQANCKEPIPLKDKRIRFSSDLQGSRFQNLEPTPVHLPRTRAKSLYRWLRVSKRRRPSAVFENAWDGAAFSASPRSGIRFAWLGQSTTLLEVDGYRILTDPVWNRRCSPVSWLGPRRFSPPPVSLEGLPDLDVVVISHDHYDHLERTATTALAAKGCLFAVPLGVGKHLLRWRIAEERIREFDWGESLLLGSLRLVATPARHHSGRINFEANRTLWASWAMVGPKSRVFFSGDTGCLEAFKEIGSGLGPFDLTLVNIDSYGEHWPYVHLTPEQALDTHLDLRGAVICPIHWGTFSLALHPWDEPIERFVAAATTRGVNFVVPKLGQVTDTSDLPKLEYWWRGPQVITELK
jgi:L-ascorbate metabolism protein UlaG (beta-lactamase superfamily)